MAYDREVQKARREAHREQGLCLHCTKPPAEGKSKCQECLEKNRAAALRYYKKNRKAILERKAQEYKGEPFE